MNPGYLHRDGPELHATNQGKSARVASLLAARCEDGSQGPCCPLSKWIRNLHQSSMRTQADRHREGVDRLLNVRTTTLRAQALHTRDVLSDPEALHVDATLSGVTKRGNDPAANLRSTDPSRHLPFIESQDRSPWHACLPEPHVLEVVDDRLRPSCLRHWSR